MSLLPSAEATRNKPILDAEDPIASARVTHLLQENVPQTGLMLEEILSRLSGHETTTPEDSFDLLGPRLLNQTLTKHSMLTFSKSTATRLEDAVPIPLRIPMEETLDLLMDLREPVLPVFLSPLI